jgi:subtilisin family serine protease
LNNYLYLPLKHYLLLIEETRMKKLFFLISLIGFISSVFAQVEITPALSDSIKYSIENKTNITAVVVLKDQVDVKSLDKQLYAEKANAQTRAYTVINTLKDKAESTQLSILSFINSKNNNEISRYESLWIINAIIIKANSEVLLEISNRNDVAFMDIDHKEVPDPTYDERPAFDKIPGSAEVGLRVVNAHKLWEMGLTGAGRLVMTRDTGVDGNHPALAWRWRGNYVPSNWAWRGTGSFPTDGNSHGTHTMGTITGLDTLTQDTIGVAFEAEWIAADFTVSSLSAFQWALNPDGDLNTIDDMPDVISNSWGITNSTGGCYQNTYASTFNSVEAAGIAIVFSAGNDGPNPQTITGPKNINTDLVNSWATGNIDGNTSTYPMRGSSSRGPSGCGGTGSLLIKPEAVAPGVNVRSAIPGGGYGFKSGTSMACPHVSGVLTLLKQAFPNKTGHEIKLALYHTAVETPSDLFANDPGELPGSVSGEDHNFGNGLIDAFAAYNYLIGAPKSPEDLSVYSDYNTPNSIQIYWTDPTNLLNGDTLTTDSYQIMIERDSVLVDSVLGDTESYTDINLEDGREYYYAINVKIDTSGLESRKVENAWTAGGSPVPSPATISSISGGQNEITLKWKNPGTNIDDTPLDDLEKINLYQDSVFVVSFNRAASDSGKQDSAIYSPTTPGIYKWYITVEDNEMPTNESETSNSVRTPLNIPIVDKFALPGFVNSINWNSQNAEIDNRGFNPPSGPYVLNLNAKPIGTDTLESFPVDLSNEQGSGVVFSFHYQPQGIGTEPPEPEDSLFVYFKNDSDDWTKIFSIEGDSLQPFVKKEFSLDSLSGGMNNYFHNDFQLLITNLGLAHPFLPRDEWFVDNVYFGIPAAIISSDKSLIEFDTTGTGFQDTVILEIQNIGLLDFNVTDVLGISGVFSVDTTNFSVQASNNFKLPVIFNPAQTGLYQGTFKIVHDIPNADTLTISLFGVCSNVLGLPESTTIPKEFRISQNYPNPFNPTTRIYYDLPVTSNVQIEVYDILGKKVKVLVNAQMKAGSHEINWNGSNESNNKVSSGIYIYKFSAKSNQKNFNAIKKMVFLK